MEYLHLIVFISINAVCCYHFYNPSSHQLLAASSFNNIPRGYRLLPPPARSYRRRSRLTRGRIEAACGDGGFTCNTPYNRSSTLQFECTSDSQCPSNYKCCPQKCFLHKICIQASSQIINGGNRRKCGKERPGQCEKWPYNCRTPYDYASTYAFKCSRDVQCPRNFKCCQQTCFLHKICSKVIQDVETPPVKTQIRPHGRKLTPTTEAREDEEEEATDKATEKATEEATEEVTEEATEEDTTEATTSTTEENKNVEHPIEPEDYDENEDNESDTTEVPETSEAVEEESATEAEIETTQTNTKKQEASTEENHEPTKENEEKNTTETELNTTAVHKVVTKNVSNITTPDSNAINSNADDYNEEDYKEDENEDDEEEEEYEDEDEAYTY